MSDHDYTPLGPASADDEGTGREQGPGAAHATSARPTDVVIADAASPAACDCACSFSWCACPADMIGGNACVTTKAALEAHTVNLGAELAGTGLTVNAFRPGTIDTAMQTWIRDQNPARIGPALRERFTSYLS